MKKGYIKKTVTPLSPWPTNVPQQINELLQLSKNSTKIVEYTGNWDGKEYDSAVVNIHAYDVAALSSVLKLS